MCAVPSGSWGGQRPGLAGYVTGTGPKHGDGTQARGARRRRAFMLPILYSVLYLGGHGARSPGAGEFHNGRNDMRKLLVVASVVVFSLPAMAQDTPTRVTPDPLTWKENPAFPKGVQIATLVGDPTKAGDVVVLRIKFTPSFQMPPHTHPYSEVVHEIRGNIGASEREKFENKGELLKPGSLCVYPAKRVHYAWTGNEEGI